MRLIPSLRQRLAAAKLRPQRCTCATWEQSLHRRTTTCFALRVVHSRPPCVARCAQRDGEARLGSHRTSKVWLRQNAVGRQAPSGFQLSLVLLHLWQAPHHAANVLIPDVRVALHSSTLTYTNPIILPHPASGAGAEQEGLRDEKIAKRMKMRRIKIRRAEAAEAATRATAAADAVSAYSSYFHGCSPTHLDFTTSGAVSPRALRELSKHAASSCRPGFSRHE